MTTVFNKKTGDLWNAEMTLKHDNDSHEIAEMARVILHQRNTLIKMLEETNSELSSVIKRLNEYEEKDFRCDQINPPDITYGQTCYENQLYLAEISGEKSS